MDYLVNARDEYQNVRSISYFTLNYTYVLFFSMILIFLLPLLLWVFIKITVKILKAQNTYCESGLLFFFDPEENERCTAMYLKDHETGPLHKNIRNLNEENDKVGKQIQKIKKQMKRYVLDKQEADIHERYRVAEAIADYRELKQRIHNVKSLANDMQQKNQELIGGFAAWINNTVDAVNETLIQEANNARNNLIRIAYTKRVDVLRKRLLQKYDSILNYFGRYNAMNEDAPVNPERVLPLEERYRKEGTPLGTKPTATSTTNPVTNSVTNPVTKSVPNVFKKRVKNVFKR